MLHLHFSNRHEALERRLLDALAAEPAGVFEAQQVVVPSAALKRALQLAIARDHGLCAQVEFSFLARWLWRQIARVVPGVAAQSPFAAPLLGWRAWQAFGDAAFVDAHPRLKRWLDDADDAMRWELGARVGALFEQYVTYRADWLAAWRASRTLALGPDEAWQAALWRRVAEQLDAADVQPGDAFMHALADARVLPAAQLPRALHLFALPALPPLYLPWLAALARRIDVHLYVANPCREHWFELVPPRRLAHLRAQGRATPPPGNRLLAAWAQPTRAHIDLLVDCVGEDGVLDDDDFVEAPHDTLLGRLQNAVLDLTELPVQPLSAADRSIEVHVCHSLTRELEALHDHLLARFVDDPTLRPSDVLVVTPDLDAAAPLIDAVFGTVPKERAIPYRITGRARSSVDAPAQALLALLSLASSRWPASEAFGVLQLGVVARRFDLDAAALQRVHDWIVEAGIRWGADAAHRARHDVPPTSRHTFAEGLERLFAGYALPSRSDAPFADVLPAGDAEGSGALALGAFAAFVDALDALAERLARPHDADGWRALLADALDTFVAAGDEAERDDLRALHAELQALAAQMHAGGVGTDPVPLAVLRVALERQLDDPARGGVPTGSVTFASMASLRGLPHALVCVVGLDDGAFPSTRRASEFDLMALQPRRGDRQRRQDDRNVFLDLLLAARRGVYLSYTGRSIRDNAPLPPSVLLAELLDTLLAASGGAAARARLVVEHPLQPFAREAFAVNGDARLRSFDTEMAEALRASLSAAPAPSRGPLSDDDDEDAPVAAPQRPFIVAPLPPLDAAWRDVPLDRLLRFFRDPSAALLERRLQIELRRPDQQLRDDEPFVADHAERSALADRLLPALLDGCSLDDARALAHAAHALPAGPLGAVALERELQGLAAFAERVRAATREPALPPRRLEVALDLDGETWRVHGDFADLRARGLVRWRYDALRPAHRLAAWLPHLLLAAARPDGVAPATEWLAADGATLRLDAPDDAHALLRELLVLYARGLREPLRFYPKASWAYVEAKQDALERARREWTATRDAWWKEGGKDSVRLALRGHDDALGPDFERVAHAVYAPLRRHTRAP